MDGELAPQEVEAVVALAKSDAGMASWTSFQLIGDTLRSEDLLHAGSTTAFVSRFAACLDSEPHLLAPAAARSVGRHRLLFKPSWMRRVVPGTAIAAAVAAVSWVVVPQMQDGTVPAAGPAMVAQAPAPAAAGVVTVAADSAAMIRDPRLDEYLRAHRVSVPTHAVVPTMRNVANSASFSQDNTQE
jgi:sigma-E factor negative regulatory protein RseA